jgi:hypothetical protein
LALTAAMCASTLAQSMARINLFSTDFRIKPEINPLVTDIRKDEKEESAILYGTEIL